MEFDRGFLHGMLLVVAFLLAFLVWHRPGKRRKRAEKRER